MDLFELLPTTGPVRMRDRYHPEDECPSLDFTPGKPSGECMSDGHANCVGCVHYREDYARLGVRTDSEVFLLTGERPISMGIDS